MDRRSALDARGLEHRFLKAAKEALAANAKVIVAVSGGVDSVVLLHLLAHWRKRLKIELAVAHVHHGPASPKQRKFRDSSAHHVAQLAATYEVPWLSNVQFTSAATFVDEPLKSLKSEAEFRDWRRGFLLQWQAEWASEAKGASVWIATAHTADDLLETRLLRLIRGTGPEGLIAMTQAQPPWLRLLLGEKKSTLVAYARLRRLKWLEDPSNRSLDPLRNWLRRSWLPALARRSKAGPDQLQRSLEQICFRPEAEQARLTGAVSESGLSRPALLSLSQPDQRRAVAQYFRQVGLRNYTAGHVEELLKRLDTGRRELKFNLVGRQWHVTSHWIVVESR